MSLAATAARTWLRETLLTPIEKAIFNAWPECAQVYQRTQIARKNLENTIESGEKPPLAVVDIGSLVPAPGLAADALVWQATVSVTYATWGVEVPPAGVPADGDTLSSMAEVGVALALVLSGADGHWPFTLVDNSISIDASAAGEAMRLLLGASLPIDAMTLTFQALCGLEIPVMTLTGPPV